MTANELRDMYLSFFRSKGHAVISGASLIPENDPTVLFTTAGMHPLVPYLLGEKHPAGTRLCNVQKCIRTGDIDSVGDASHLTFFEMMGNWSLGDYFKEEAIAWSYEFLTSREYLGFKPELLFVTVFEGDANAPRDEQSIAIWKKLGIPEARITALPKDDNWWGPAGKTGPCGPDTEMFIDTQPGAGAGRPGQPGGRFLEIWNDVFMQYEKKDDGSHVPLRQNNVDTGMGVERTVTMLQGRASVYDTELFAPIMAAIGDGASRRRDENEDTQKAYRVIADHVRSSVFILGDERGVAPGNLGQGYVLRRLIRRAVRYARAIGLKEGFFKPLAESVVENYKGIYPELAARHEYIVMELVAEEGKFEKTLDHGTAELSKVIENLKTHGQGTLSGRMAFRLYDTCGFPLEFTEEICREHGIAVDREGFEKSFAQHRDVSRQGSEQAFKGGLADNSEATTRLHTATHLLHKALQTILGDHVRQKGSNITTERLRFDFSHPDKMTPEQIKQVEDMVNKAIQDQLPINMDVMTIEQARERNAMALFNAKYGEQVKVYAIGGYSLEVCGGPHAKNTSELGRFRIQKEESSSAGVRRIRAVLE